MPAATSSGSFSSTTKSGIQTSAAGDSIIPSSVRADGSIRKEIRVRPGYRPPEDIEVYKNRSAEFWKNKESAGIPGAEAVNTDGGPKSTATNKNAKRREARKKAANVAKAEDNINDATTSLTMGYAQSGNLSDSRMGQATSVDSEAEKEKEARKLSKKLRQAKDLEAKKDKGDSLLPEQLEKVIKIHELVRQLEVLGFNADGEKKSGS
ncbi:MAG: hypothetical protein M1820_006160 [Bogoriella megaspora]|nr:MAG: hypothetical protein M1820_006160 [Bogoriella megaspora]